MLETFREFMTRGSIMLRFLKNFVFVSIFCFTGEILLYWLGVYPTYERFAAKVYPDFVVVLVLSIGYTLRTGGSTKANQSSTKTTSD